MDLGDRVKNGCAKTRWRLLYFALVLPPIGCQTTMYDWGTYEESVYRMYSTRENFNVAKEIDRLQKEIDRSLAKKRRVPPGKAAHLAYLFHLAGDSQQARRCFALEKDLYPESEQLVTFLSKSLP